MLDGAVQFLPWWQALLVRIACGILVMFGRTAGPLLWSYLRSLEPVEAPVSPPMTVGPDGTIHLDQTPPKDNL